MDSGISQPALPANSKVMVEHLRGSTPCGSTYLVDLFGNALPLVALIDAPDEAWRDGETSPWETLIYFGDAAGAKSAWRLARWLRAGHADAPVSIGGRIGVVIGHHHAPRPCWRALFQAAPFPIDTMPDQWCSIIVEWASADVA